MRRRLGASALGHWGTLDPSACGVLVLAVGSATRLLPFLTDSDKSYVFELRAGVSTDTGDAHGAPIARADLGERWHDRLHEVAASLAGDLVQVPPAFSAVKVDGRPLYKSARKGMKVAAPPRTIRIHDLRVLGVEGAVARMAVSCSAGTYVRTLCEQIGERLGLPAHMGFLLRTQAGPFALEAARTPAEIDADPEACLLKPAAVLTLPRIEIGRVAAERFVHGNGVVAENGSAAPTDTPALVLCDGELIGVATIDGDAILPLRVLTAGDENR